VTFGPQFFFQGLNYTLTTVGIVPVHCRYGTCDGSDTSPECFDPFPLQTNIYSYSGVTGQVADPSYIGIDCNVSPPRLGININIASSGSATGAIPQITSIVSPADYYSDYANCPEDFTTHPPTQTCMHTAVQVYTDDGSGFCTAGCNPETIRTQAAWWAGVNNDAAVNLIDNGTVTSPGAPFNNEVPTVTGNIWHHVIVSVSAGSGVSSFGQVFPLGDPAFDDTQVGASTRISGSSSMWVSFDDTNLTGRKLSIYNMLAGSSTNDVPTPNAYLISREADVFGTTGYICNVGVNSAIEFDTSTLPTYASPVGNISFGTMSVPSHPDYVDKIRKVEMAELQLFTGISMDTGIEVNRRFFLTADGLPANPLSAELGLGQAPDVQFHSQNDFISGTNVGGAGTTGNFSPTGTINPFTPGPQIGA
jgi:hypothetical protein